MRVAVLSPLPPTRTGVAHYTSMILPALQLRYDVRAFGSIAGYRREDFDVAVYQLGNNPHHEFVYTEAMANPGVAVLHDLVLHHLIVEMTLARGDAEGYARALRASHGDAGEAWARGRAAGLHTEMGNFLLPASVEVANRSRAVIVHNQWAAERLASFGVTTPIEVVPHPFIHDASTYDRDVSRRRLGFATGDHVIGLFGFLTSAKRAEVVVEAFKEARRRDSSLRLLIAGEPAPNIDLSSIEAEGVVMTGYVSDELFGEYYASADRLVNLRYPTAGETSGTLIRAFDAGKPVAVSDYAQFAILPDTCVTRIPLGTGEVDALLDYFLAPIDTTEVAEAQRQWLEANASLEQTVEGYGRAIQSTGRVPSQQVNRAFPLFPAIEVTRLSHDGDRITFSIANRGEMVLRTRVYGQPGYRMIVKLHSDGREVDNRWLELPGDLAPGASVELSVPFRENADSMTLHHALESIPVIDATPAARLELRGVR